MKSLILFLSLLLAFPVATMAIPPNNLMGEIPDNRSETPVVLTITQETNRNICTIVAINSIQAKRNKNDGLTVKESIAQLDAAIETSIDEYGSELDEPSDMSNKLSYMMIGTIYQVELVAETEQELVDLGLIIYENCFNSLMKDVLWDIEDSI